MDFPASGIYFLNLIQIETDDYLKLTFFGYEAQRFSENLHKPLVDSTLSPHSERKICYLEDIEIKITNMRLKLPLDWNRFQFFPLYEAASSLTFDKTDVIFSGLFYTMI